MKKLHRDVTALLNSTFRSALTGDYIVNDSIRLKHYDILYNASEPVFINLAQQAATICGAKLSILCFFTDHGQWIKARWANSYLVEPVKLIPDRLWLYDPILHEDKNPLSLKIFPSDKILSEFNLNFCTSVPIFSSNGMLIGSLILLDEYLNKTTSLQNEALCLLAYQCTRLLELRQTLHGLSQANARLEQQPLTDNITGIANRRAFDYKSELEIARAQRRGDSLSLAIFGIDQFSEYRALHGQAALNTILSDIAWLLQASVRSYDFLAHYDDGEFTLLLPETKLADALLVATRLRALIMSKIFKNQNITLSIGIAHLVHGSNFQNLIENSKDSLYLAQKKGGNKIMVGGYYDTSMGKLVANRF